MTWFMGLDTIVRRVAVIGAIVCLLIVVGVAVGWCSQRGNVARAKFGSTVAERQAELGSDAAQTTARVTDAESQSAAQTARNTEEISRAENANETAGDAGNVGLRALCKRMLYHDSHRCVELRRLDRANAAD